MARNARGIIPLLALRSAAGTTIVLEARQGDAELGERGLQPRAGASLRG